MVKQTYSKGKLPTLQKRLMVGVQAMLIVVQYSELRMEDENND